MSSTNIKNKSVDINPSTVLMVSNISRNVTKKHLQEIFSQYGELKGVYVPRNEETKLQKSYIFLEYTNQENAEKALLYFSGGQIDGLIVKVDVINQENILNNSINAKNKIERDRDLNHEKDYKIENFEENKNKNLDSENKDMNDNKKNIPSGDFKSNLKRMRSRSRSRKKSRSNSYSRYKKDNHYKSSQNYNNYYHYGGNRRHQDYNDKNRRKYRRRDSRSFEKSSHRSSSRSSHSSS